MNNEDEKDEDIFKDDGKKLKRNEFGNDNRRQLTKMQINRQKIEGT